MGYDSLFASVPGMYDYLERRLIESKPTEIVEKINRFHLPEINDEFNGSRFFIFMTRPDLYLFDSSLRLVSGIDQISYMEHLWTDSNVGRLIMKSLQQRGSDFDSPFLPIISNRCKGYTPTDTEIEAVDRGQTLFGHSIAYGKHNIKSRASSTISLSFSDNINLVLYNTLKVWIDYIEHVSIGLCNPRREDILDPKLDYASSIYYLVTRPDMREIIYWEKLVGVFPLVTPDSAFASQEGSSIQPEYNISFKYSMKDRSMNPLILTELNKLAQSTGLRNKGYAPNYNVDAHMHGVPYVTTPIIVKENGKFILRWWA